MFDTIIKRGMVVDGTGAAAYAADVAVRDGRIVEIGAVDGPARQTIDADGALVTPGFIDIHTHYDGQATWDDTLEASAAHGVTTVVMGNCGVGFAPVRPSDTDALIDMMEGVEDIPGSALSAGMPFGEWETFPEYLDVLASRRYSLDVAAQLPHSALRFYVMGERAVTDNDASAADLERMATLTREAMAAGAVGLSTSRTIAHRARTGRLIPGTFAPREELLALGSAMADAGHGVIEAILGGSVGNAEPVTMIDEMPLMEELAMVSRRPVTFSTFQLLDQPDMWRRVVEYSDEAVERGAILKPQVIPRAITFFTSLRTYHMFMYRPTYRRIAELPLAERVAQMRLPEIRAAILAESPVSVDRRDIAEVLSNIFAHTMGVTFPITHPVDYEPHPSASVRSQAKQMGKDPVEHMYDLLLADEGMALYMILSSNYVAGDLEVCREMMLHPNTVTGNGDSGAHVNFISDCSVTTFHLSHWTRDRSRGDVLPIELMVSKMTGSNAHLYGFHDRGTVEVGKRADLNVIDHERLGFGLPELHHDLPAGASRILQSASGYLATMVRGQVTRRHDVDTGVRPGRLRRGVAAPPG